MIEVDGAFGSGGGQILRSAISLSAVTKKPCRIFNIRKNRPKPGLAHQHLLGVQALSQLCNGRLEGDEISSEEIKFYPGEAYRERVSVDIPTAGSITLVLQTLILPALFAPFPVEIKFNGGATDTFFSPTIDYFRYVFLKILEKTEAKVEVNILRRGYYPEGGAKVEVKIYPVKFTPYRNEVSGAGLKTLNLTEKGELKKFLVISGASEYLRTKKVAERQLAGAREILGKLKLPIEERVEYYQTDCPGSQICLIVEFENTVIGTDNLGKLGKRAEDVGREAALELLKEEKSGACLDRHLSDQVLPYLAMAKSKNQVTVSELTPHSKTNIWVIEKFLNGKPSTKAGLGAGLVPHRNEVSGAGFKIKNNLISWVPF